MPEETKITYEMYDQMWFDFSNGLITEDEWRKILQGKIPYIEDVPEDELMGLQQNSPCSFAEYGSLNLILKDYSSIYVPLPLSVFSQLATNISTEIPYNYPLELYRDKHEKEQLAADRPAKNFSHFSLRYVHKLFSFLGSVVNPKTDPNFDSLFAQGQYHTIASHAFGQIKDGGGQAALGYYQLGYVYELGLQRSTTALAYYHAGLQLSGQTHAGAPRTRAQLATAVERTLRTRYERIEAPVEFAISVLVKGRAKILAPDGGISVGRVPQADTRYRLTSTLEPLDEKSVYIEIDRTSDEAGKLHVSNRDSFFLADYLDDKFRVANDDVIRFFVEEHRLSPPDTSALIAAYAQFARRYPRSPLASWARRAIREFGAAVAIATDDSPSLVSRADVDADIPETGAINVDAVAVIIGNRNYTEHNPDVPDVEFALRDAAVVKQYLSRMLGFQEGNILYYEDATNAVFRSLFGTRDIPHGRLAQLVKPGKSDVFVYYSGHGAPDVGAERGYFLPIDCAPEDVRLNGYSLDLFYDNLKQIEARSTTVAIDAGFSGGSQEGMLIESASPVGIRVTNPALALTAGVVFASSSGDEISSWYPEMGHGLFTYFFLKGLRGEADMDGDQRITAGELSAYVANRSEGVPYWARRLYQGRQQTPNFFGDPDYVIFPAANSPLTKGDIPPKDDIPRWHLNPLAFIDSKYGSEMNFFFGTGQATNMAVSVAQQVADARALEAIVRQVILAAVSQIRNYMEQSGIGSNNQGVLELTNAVSNAISSSRILEAQIIKRDVSTDGKTYFSLAIYPLNEAQKLVYEAVANVLSNQKDKFHEFKAKKAFRELDAKTITDNLRPIMGISRKED